MFISRPVWLALLFALGIAFFEYCRAVPANRIGHAVYYTAELKTMQEVITLIVFAGFATFWLGARMTVNHLIGFALISGGAFFIFKVTIAASQEYKSHGNKSRCYRSFCTFRPSQCALPPSRNIVV